MFPAVPPFFVFPRVFRPRFGRPRLGRYIAALCFGLAVFGGGTPGDGSGMDVGDGGGATAWVPGVSQARAAEGATGSRADKMAKRSRDEAAETGGSLIQLDTMWVPVARGSRRSYVGFTVQLTPLKGMLPEACYTTPWVTEAMIEYFNKRPLRLGSQRELDTQKLQQGLMDAVNKVAGPGVFKMVRLIDGPPEPLDQADNDLSLVCR